VRVAVEREETPRFEGARCERVIEILSGGIAIDFDGDALPSRPTQTPRPNSRSRPRASQRCDRGGAQGSGRPDARLRRRQDHVEGDRLVVGEIQLASGVDVRFNALQQPEPVSIPGVDPGDRVRCWAASAIDMAPAILSPYE
jgi:hypothetical protein